MSAQIHDGRITCPHCKHTVQVVRKYGAGATYVGRWRALPVNCGKVLAVWVGSELRHVVATKKRLRDVLADNGLVLTPNACNARISELVGLGIVQMTRYDTEHHDTKHAPMYTLNLERAEHVLNEGGKL